MLCGRESTNNVDKECCPNDNRHFWASGFHCRNIALQWKVPLNPDPPWMYRIAITGLSLQVSFNDIWITENIAHTIKIGKLKSESKTMNCIRLSYVRIHYTFWVCWILPRKKFGSISVVFMHSIWYILSEYWTTNKYSFDRNISYVNSVYSW